VRQGVQAAIDLAVLSIAFWLGYLFRFEFSIPPAWMSSALIGSPYVVLIEYALLSALGVPNFSWRYVSIREAVRIAIAIASATALLVGLRLTVPVVLKVIVPYGVLCMNLFLGFVGLVGARAT